MGFLRYITSAICVGVLYIATLVVYRLCLHPLAKVSGPKLAAVSKFYEWYFDCIRPGIYCWKIQEWHRKYGPMIRIGPNEIHVDDPEWFDTLYSASMKLDKDPWFYGFLGNHDSVFSTVEYDVHRVKRSKQNAFFSRQSVDKYAPILTKVLNNTLDRFEEYRGTEQPLQIKNLTRSYSADVVCEYCFPGSMDFVKAPDFSEVFHSGQENFARMFPWFRRFPFLPKIVFALPKWILSRMNRETQAVVAFIRFIEQQVRDSVQSTSEKTLSDKRTIIKELYAANMPKNYRTPWALEQEATTLVAAATATPARVLENGIFYILQSPGVARKLTEELRAYKPSARATLLTHRELEALPYLTAVILECQRISPAVPSRFPRINRSQDMFYQGYRIPKGTVVGMSIWDILLSDKVWGDGHEFRPDRWLDSGYRANMQKYMVPFGRGSRNCIGQNVAVAELFTVLGNVFRNFDLELFETTEREIEIVQDCFIALPYEGSLGVQVLVR